MKNVVIISATSATNLDLSDKLLIKDKDKFVVKIGKYLESFYDFCFVLDDDIMIKGKINFKFQKSHQFLLLLLMVMN